MQLSKQRSGRNHLLVLKREYKIMKLGRMQSLPRAQRNLASIRHDGMHLASTVSA